jgi:hypothetical protein
LVRATGTLHATTDAIKALDDIVDVLPTHQLADALKIAVAAAKEEYLLNDVVLVGSHVNELGARALRLILYMLCHYQYVLNDYLWK